MQLEQNTYPSRERDEEMEEFVEEVVDYCRGSLGEIKLCLLNKRHFFVAYKDNGIGAQTMSAILKRLVELNEALPT